MGCFKICANTCEQIEFELKWRGTLGEMNLYLLQNMLLGGVLLDETKGFCDICLSLQGRAIDLA